MRILGKLFIRDFKHRIKDSFMIGYNIIFPVVMVALLGYLTSESYGKEFTGYQYYSIVMLPFCIAMAIISAAYAGKDEAYRKTAIRFLYTPITKAQIVLSKLFSCTLVISICNLVVLVFSILVFGLPIGDKFLFVSLLLLAETFAICTIGLFIGFGMKNFILLKNILNIPIMIAAILAGSFYPFGTLNDKLAFVIKLSPLTWMNRSLFLCIYDNQTTMVWRLVIICGIIGICFTILTIMLFKKEEYIHGDLPGYEK